MIIQYNTYVYYICFRKYAIFMEKIIIKKKKTQKTFLAIFERLGPSLSVEIKFICTNAFQLSQSEGHVNECKFMQCHCPEFAEGQL